MNLDSFYHNYRTYILLLAVDGFVLAGWRTFIKAQVPTAKQESAFSLVVPFRNEEAKLPALLSSINELDYDKLKLEIIFIDDGSEDLSADIVTAWIKSSPFCTQLIQSDDAGKKAAQYAGVLLAKNRWIACTDADCVLPRNWIKRLNDVFDEENVVLVFGGVQLTGTGQNLQKLEFLSLIGSTMAMLVKNWPVMGNGANMAFSKEIFLTVFPVLKQRATPSGDDVFLLHEVARLKQKVGVLHGNDVVVQTPAQPNMAAFIAQRLRWASKAKGYHSIPAIAVATLVFAINTTLLVMAMAACFRPQLWSSFALLFGVKCIVDFILLRQFSAFYQQPFTILHFIGQELVNLIYIPFIAIFSQLISYRWKGRKY